MDYDTDGLQRMYLNGEDVTKEIRLPQISMYASRVSALPEVRAFLMDMQRDMAKSHNCENPRPPGTRQCAARRRGTNKQT